MQLENIDLAKLSVSPANMRNAKKPPDISDILPSVRVRGVLVPLLVRPNGSADSFEIVAGRRRYHAATTVAEEGGSAGPLPCAILEEGDDAAALEAAREADAAPKPSDPPIPEERGFVTTETVPSQPVVPVAPEERVTRQPLPELQFNGLPGVN